MLRGDPLQGNLLLGVGHVGQVEEHVLAFVAVLAVALEAHHLAGDAGHGLLHGDLAGVEALLDVGAGGAVGGAALQQAQLDAANLGAGGGLHHGGQAGSQAAQLGMAEAVGAGGLGLGDEGSVGVVDALGDRHQAVLLLGVDPLHVGDELIHVEVHLGQVDQVGAVALLVGQSGRGGEPAGVAAHALDDGDHAGVIHGGIAIDLHHGGGDVLGRGGEARAVVGAVQVVVDGLGNAHHAAVIAHLGAVAADLVAGVHGVVATVVEEVPDVVLLEDLQNALVVGVVHVGVRNLVAAGAQGGDVLAVQGGLDDAVGGSVDDGRGAAGLADHGCADQGLVGHCIVTSKIKLQR